MPIQPNLFDNFIKPYSVINGYQMENVQGSRYRPAQIQSDTVTKSASDDDITQNMSDKFLPSDSTTKLKAKIEQATKIPDYIYNGLKGDPDANFFEFLQICKVPYYIGGPVLTGMFMAGISHIDQAARNSAILKTKQVALGVGLYYAFAALANKVIDAPVKWFRGIDLNHPYKDIVDLREGSPLDMPQNKKKEYHKVFESIDFTRWDLLYDENAKKDAEINKKYNEIGKKYGIKGNVNDADTTLKEKIKETIIMSRAWKYALTVPFVGIGIGLANQNAWKGYGQNLKLNIKNILDSKAFLKGKTTKICNELMTKLATPVKEAFVQLWNGQTKIQGVLGKAAILSAVLGTIIANMLILQKTHVNNEKLVEETKKENETNG